jgi:hypothetical protein
MIYLGLRPEIYKMPGGKTFIGGGDKQIRCVEIKTRESEICAAFYK